MSNPQQLPDSSHTFGIAEQPEDDYYFPPQVSTQYDDVQDLPEGEKSSPAPNEINPKTWNPTCWSTVEDGAKAAAIIGIAVKRPKVASICTEFQRLRLILFT
jgi:hypothetical protein